MYQKNFYSIIIPFALLCCLVSIIVIGCQPIREFQSFDKYQGEQSYKQKVPQHATTRKTVVLIADNQGTEIFDLLAPFYLFSSTGKANVYMLAPEKEAIVLRKGLFILPHYSFQSFARQNIEPDLIVIPNLSTLEADSLNPEIISWVKTNYQTHTRLLSVCDGALTAAATGLYDDQPITTHASDLEIVSRQFDKPVWVRDISVTQSGRLYSTAGVSHAVEGSLWVIRDMFGEVCMQKVMAQINYPWDEPKTAHQSIPVSFGHKLRILNKVLFSKNERVGVLLQDGISEFELAALMDTYHRSFPATIKSYTIDDQPVRSGNGLLLIPTGKLRNEVISQIHILGPEALLDEIGDMDDSQRYFYHEKNDTYIFDYLLTDIENRYGPEFKEVVKVLLDYN